MRLAERDGWAIAIGHPHTNTLRVLQQMLPKLPADITLVPPSQLLNEARSANNAPPVKLPGNKRHDSFRGVQTCMIKHPLPPVPASRALILVSDSLSSSPLLQKVAACFSGLHIDLNSLKAKAIRQP